MNEQLEALLIQIFTPGPDELTNNSAILQSHIEEVALALDGLLRWGVSNF